MRTGIGVFSALLVFIGFGMIHSGSTKVELTGSTLIGIGCVILLILIFSKKKV